ncbi:MAG: response regulator [Acidobacteriota bacterium]|nr:response regulator [Acidobacteriota bacterium]
MLDIYAGEESILVTDDEPLVLSLTTKILRKHGYKVYVARNGEEALLLHVSEQVDLVLTDVIMPHMTGPELVHELKRKKPDLRCLYMSGYDPGYIRNSAGEHVGCDYLLKPFTAEALLKKIRHTLDAGKEP